MALLHRFRRNVLMKTISDVLTRGLTFAFGLVVAKYLGAEEFGVFSSAQIVAYQAAILADLGIHLLLTREVAAKRAHGHADIQQYVGNVLTLKLSLSAFAILVVTGLSLTPAFSDLAGPLLLSAIFMLSWSSVEFLSAVLCGFERMEWEAVLKGAGRALVIVLGGGVLLAGGGLNELLVAMASAPVIMLVASIIMVRRRTPGYRPGRDVGRIRAAFAQALPLAVINILVTAFVRIDIPLLETLRGDHHEIGIYSAAVRIIDALGGVALIFVGAVFPILSDLVHTRPDAFRALERDVLRLMALLGIPVCATGLILAPWIISLLGSDYAESTTAFRLLIADIPFLYMNVHTSNMLVAAGRIRSLLLPAAVALVVNLGLNLILIPHYGYRGAAVATVSTEVVLFVVIAITGRGVLPARFPLFLWRYLVAGGAAGAVLFALNARSPFLGLAVSAPIYLGTLRLLGEFPPGDVARVARLVGSRFSGALTGGSRPR